MVRASFDEARPLNSLQRASLETAKHPERSGKLAWIELNTAEAQSKDAFTLHVERILRLRAALNHEVLQRFQAALRSECLSKIKETLSQKVAQ